ncbi:uncharacterized protein LOC135646191 isoform X2 [Musa acuminata AAA Group]|uniref:uncharacterized protein LOC135646191 isoform X2 n=1 Tax=Musa acuminata AAA Group TaxID=214697 RepID=UPI0031D8080A
MAAAAISELDPSKDAAAAVVEEIVRLERKIFPKHESLSKSFHDELRKKNSGVMYLKTNKGKEGEEEIVGEGESQKAGSWRSFTESSNPKV